MPFPSLRHLNLANNQIEEEESLLALSTWPRLEEVVIWGNPVAISGKGGPPVVMHQLGLVAGIEVARYMLDYRFIHNSAGRYLRCRFFSWEASA